jgi:hypothetical protein
VSGRPEGLHYIGTENGLVPGIDVGRVFQTRLESGRPEGLHYIGTKTHQSQKALALTRVVQAFRPARKRSAGLQACLYARYRRFSCSNRQSGW